MRPDELVKARFGRCSVIGYIRTSMSGFQGMSRDTAADHNGAHSAHAPARLAMVLLVIVGWLLVGAGALLWSRHGAAVFVDNPVLAVLAWCF